MKNKIIIKVTSLVLAAIFFSTCEKTPMEKAQDAYDASMVVPAVLSTSGPALALQTFPYDFKVTYDRAGSTWNWSAVDATVQKVSDDKKTATILFDKLPASDTALVKITETTVGGTTSPEKILKVKVNAFCPLANGLTDLVGSWSGDDATYVSNITTVVDGTNLKVSGMGDEFMADFWGEEVVSGGTFAMTVNANGTLDIPRQYIFTTTFDGDPYDYEIKGAGTWDNCSTSPTFLITYDIYYPGDAKGLAATYASYLGNIPYLTADIVLGDSKSDQIIENTYTPLPRKFKK
jgi:hypothetical protein